MKICQGICHSSQCSAYQCKGTVKQVHVEGWSETFLYCDTAITLCKKSYKVTIVDSDDTNCETNSACTCDMNIIMLRGCQCGGK